MRPASGSRTDVSASSGPDVAPVQTRTTWRVIIVDDHAVTRSGIRMMAECIDGVAVVGEASNGLEALALTRELQPHAVLMDVDMPEMNGIEALKAIREELPDTAVLILSVHEDGDAVFDAVQAGASGYLAKSSSLTQVQEAMDTLREGGTYMTPSVAGLAIHSLTRKVDDARRAAQARTVTTPREREILEHLTQGLSARSIARRLDISERTVNTHIGHIYRKLGVNNRVDAVLEGIRLGLVEQPS